MADFQFPDFLQGQSPEEIHKKMRDVIPADIDMSEGQLPHDLTFPTALIASQTAQSDLPRLMGQIWPQFAYGVYLDYHAKTRTMERKAAQRAAGQLRITGQDGTPIPAGSVFATVSRNDNIAVEFTVTRDYTITGGSVTADIEAVAAGSGGNVAADLIVIVISDNLNGIKSVTNPGATGGGFNEESDDELRERIIQYDQSMSGSFIGNEADYKRWALSVVGVGEAVIIPANDDSGLVTIVATDANGDPASPALCQQIYDYIMEGANERAERFAPVNANLSVVSPTTIEIRVEAAMELESGAVLDDVKALFTAAVKAYFLQARSDEEIRYSKVYQLLQSIAGVYDIRDVTLNGGGVNIPLQKTLLPVTDDTLIVLTEGVV